MLATLQLESLENERIWYFDITFWFQTEFNSSFLLFLNYLQLCYQGKVCILTIQGTTRTRHNLPSLLPDIHFFTDHHNQNKNYICFTKVLLDSYCCYCGFPMCFEPHPDIKLLEIWCKPLAWMSLGYDLFISHPQETRFHSTDQREFFIYIVDFPLKKVLMYNDTTSQLYPSIGQHTSFLNLFPARKEKKLLSLQTWAIRGLVKGHFDLSNLTHYLPYPSLKAWEIVGKCLRELGRWPNPLEDFTLHQIEGHLSIASS